MRQASFFLTACAGHGSRPSVSLCSTRCATGVALEYPFGRAYDDAFGSQFFTACISLKCMLYVCLECSAQDVSFSWRAGKAFKGETGAAECLFYSPFAAVCYKYGAGGASGGNGAENSFVPQLRLGGRRECVIKYYGRCSICAAAAFFFAGCFPIVFFP